MLITYYHVDAFTDRLFSGNPAGVCPLERWLPDEILQYIAAENNLSETAFFIPQGEVFHLRWFTPTIEVDLCGHATLAASHVLFSELGYKSSAICFQTLSGQLIVTRSDDTMEMDFPARPPLPCAPPENLVNGLGAAPVEVLKARDYFAVFESETQVASLKPDMALLAQLDCLGIIVTAPGKSADFVSRFFAPAAGIAEDPVTGSSHCSLIPFWSRRLNKTRLFARQISKRGGVLFCRDLGERVGIGGQAVLYSRAELTVPA
jgi:PhzF family phenazine biosynthesis protein